MSQESDDYLTATKHPYACLLFLLPILAVYEGGVLFFGGGAVNRTGADNWLRELVQSFGVPSLHWPPIAIVLFFAAWAYRRRSDRPKDMLGVFMGMTIEAVVFALILWGVGRGQQPLLDRLGITLAAGAPSGETNQRMARAVSFLGAGIYEEVLFRLILLSLLLYVFGKSLPKIAIIPGALVLSAVLFSAAHHLGPSADAVENKVFLFRSVAGVYFALIFLFRGFGIAAGAHACYDVLVGAAMV